MIHDSVIASIILKSEPYISTLMQIAGLDDNDFDVSGRSGIIIKMYSKQE